jgi:hypothetical protein
MATSTIPRAQSAGAGRDTKKLPALHGIRLPLAVEAVREKAGGLPDDGSLNGDYGYQARLVKLNDCINLADDLSVIEWQLLKAQAVAELEDIEELASDYRAAVKKLTALVDMASDGGGPE